ncbi:MAG: hypothetical protein QOE70_3535 [Chthoniobacter sp.]|jgi:hypothetical protein|nr:hypothetical protein [Chthoniobacter sp.]
MAIAPSTRAPNGFLVFLGSLAALLLGAIIFIMSIAAGPSAGDLDQKRADQRQATHERLEKEAAETLASTAWVDKGKGIARVPVTDVFAATAAELKAKKPAASQVKVEPPLPMPVADPNSQDPPPPALPSAPQGADTIRFAPPEPAKPSASLNPPARPPLTATAKLEK